MNLLWSNDRNSVRLAAMWIALINLEKKMTNQENSLNSQQLPVVIDSQIPPVDRRKLLQALSAIPFIANADGFVNQLYAQSLPSADLADSEEFDLELIFSPSINAYTQAPTTTTHELFYSSMYARKEVNDNWTLSHISSFITQKYNPIRKHIVCAAMYRALLEQPAITGHDIEKILSNEASFDAAAAAIDKDKKVDRLDWFKYWTRRYSTVPEDMVKLYKNKPKIPYTRQALTNALKSAQNKTEDQLSDLHMHKQAKFKQIEVFLDLTLHSSELSAWKNKANRGIAQRRLMWCIPFLCTIPDDEGGLEQDPGKDRQKYLRINKKIIDKPIEREPLKNTRGYFMTFIFGPSYTKDNMIKHGYSSPTLESARTLSQTVNEKGKKIIYKINLTNSKNYTITDLNNASIDHFIDLEFKAKKTYIPNGNNITDQKNALKNMTLVATEITGDPYLGYIIASRVLQAVSQVVIALARISIYRKTIDIGAYQQDLHQLIETGTSLTTKSQKTRENVLSTTILLTGTTLGLLVNSWLRFEYAEEKFRKNKDASEAAVKKYVDEAAKVQWTAITAGTSATALSLFSSSLIGYSSFYDWIRYFIPGSFIVSDATSSISEIYGVLSAAKRDQQGKLILKSKDYTSLAVGAFRGFSAFSGGAAYINRGRAWSFEVNGITYSAPLFTAIGATLSAGGYFVGVIYANS